MSAPTTGLVARYKASDIALSVGSSISSWPDSGPNGYTASQATAAYQPALQSVTANGKTFAVARFDGVDDFLETPSFAIGPDFTVFAVVVADPTAADSVNGIVNMDGTPRIFQLRFGNLSIASFIGFTTGAAPDEDQMPTTAKNWQVLCGTRGTGTVEVFVNGSSNGSASDASNASGTEPMYIGAASGTAQPGNVDIAEIALYDHALSSADRASFDSYVQDTYGITVSDYVPSGGGSASLSDSLTISTALSRVASAARSLADTLGLTSAVARAATAARGIADSIGIATGIGRSQTQHREASDAISLADTLTGRSADTRVIADSLSLTTGLSATFAPGAARVPGKVTIAVAPVGSVSITRATPSVTIQIAPA